MSFTPPRLYDRLKRLYPNLYVLFRDFGVNRANFDINRSGLQVSSDVGDRTITFKGDVLELPPLPTDFLEKCGIRRRR
jgi:hypothetical protein